MEPSKKNVEIKIKDSEEKEEERKYGSKKDDNECRNLQQKEYPE